MSGYTESKYTGFAIETVIASLVFSLGDIIVAVNHGETGGQLAKSTGANFLMIVVAHVLFQMGGLYTVLYPPVQTNFNFRME
jgi:hypothetical protein